MDDRLKSNIFRYLVDKEFFQAKRQELVAQRKLRNYFCKGFNGQPIPIKEIGDVFGLFDGLTDDHTNKLLPVLLELGIPVYAKRRNKTVDKKFEWAIEKNLLIYLD
jgi:hypothetical protein